MNPEEAKVPNVEGDWQSIEIFLFSNGQQYSPPRKYLLRIDDLNLWDATLNHLAQKHYGLQSPLINLYTTSGHLVKGPLDLRDGQAYVAVEPQDTFVDAGYQKYLIKASRSWEKRQARKKPRECVPDDPCCLCSERGRSCCDPDACCLCPEKEDADSVELLLPATGHPESRPAGGHYMSSAPAKPVAADDYEPISGNIGHMTCKLCGNKASPGEFKYSPVPDNQNGNEAELSDNRVILAENEARSNENVARPGDYGSRPGKNSSRSGEYEARQGEHETRSNVNGVRPGEFGTGPPEYGTRLDEYEIRSSVNGARPDEFGAKPAEYETKQGKHETRPNINDARRGEFEASPGEFGSRPAEYETKPSAKGAKLGGYATKLGEYETRPGEYGGRPSEYKTRSSVNGAKPGEYEKETSANGVKPVEYGARQGKYDMKLNVNGVRPVEFVSEPADYGTRPVEYDTIPSLNGVKQAQYQTKPGEYKARLDEYETKPIVNGAQPGEYGAKYTEYASRLNEYDTNPTVNGFKPGEYGARLAEYDTTPSENTTKLGEYVTKQGEYDTKPDEYITKPNVNGGKPGEYRGEPGKYDNKPSGPTTAEYKVKPGECATRSAEQENRSGRDGSNPVKNGAWTGEDGDRTTGHKARPGYSGPRLSKIEPIKEAYEIALRKNEKSLDESENELEKDIVDKDASKKYPTCLGEKEKEKQGEFRTRDGDQKVKEIESKDMSSGNGRSGGERRISSGEKNIRENDTVTRLEESKARKNENTLRLSGRRGAETDQRGKSGKPTKEYEHGGKVNTQKGKETNPAGRAGGNGTRLSEQRNRQSDNLTRLGGRETRVGDHEARAGDIGFPTNDHDTGLVYPNSREAEPGTRAAASGARATPKDRINSRAKHGNLGQLKIGTPGTKLEDALVKLDDSAIKNREGNPVTRHSRIGGPGAAGTLHISEAQQHGRKSSLSAGRPSIEKKRLSVGQNSSLLKKPTPNYSILRKLEDKQPLKTNRENLPKKINEPVNSIPVPTSNESRKSNTLPKSQPTPLPQSTISVTNVASLPTNKVTLENCIDEKEIIVSTHSFKDPESETRSMKMDSVKHIIDVIEKTTEETQTEQIYTEKSIVYVSVDEGVQTNTETVEQHEQEVSASSKEKVNSCTCTLCKPIYDNAAFDNDENTLSMLNKGGVVNIKLNIEVRNIVKSVYSCQKNCGRSRSLTNITRSEKESQISIDNDVVVNHNSLQSLFTKQNFRGFGFENSPNVMVVQCAGCGKPNPPRCDPSPPCCDNNKKYFVLLNSVLEDKEDGCNFNPPCRPCDQRQSRKQSNGIPIKQAFSETTLDTITTVTVSGVPLQRREIGKCMTNTSCQTEDPQNECLMTNHKVSKTQDSVTTCDTKKKSNCSICVGTQAVNLMPKQSCLKMCSQKCEQEYSQVCSDPSPSTPPPVCEKVRSVCSHIPPPSCENDRPVCSQVPPPTCQKVQLVCSLVPPATCEREHSVCSHVPPAICQKVQSVSSHEPPPVCEKEQSVCSHVPLTTCQKVQPTYSQVPPAACQKVRPDCSHEPPPVCGKEQSVYSHVPPPKCQKVQSVCSHVPLTTCQKVQPACSQVPPTVCQKIQPDCSHEPPPVCEKEQSVCSHVPPPKSQNVQSVCSHVPLTTCQKVVPACSQVPPAACQTVQPDCSHEPPPKCEKVQSVCSHVPLSTCQKVQPACSQVPPAACQKVQPDCSHVPPPKCEKVRSVCSQVSSQTCVQVQSKGCQPTSSNVQPQGCMPMPASSQRTPPQCMQVQAYLQVPQVCNSETQTRWASILARRHCDGRYSFHLPPLYLLKNNFSCCQ